LCTFIKSLNEIIASINLSIFSLEILPIVKASCPNLIGTLTKAFLVDIVSSLFVVMIFEINNLTALEPISIVAKFYISLILSN